MDDLVMWLRAQLGDDEQAAKAAMWAGDERWAVLAGHEQPFHRPWQVVDATYDEGLVVVRPHAADDSGVAEHIARWDPARVLAEVEAKRRILDVHAPFHDYDPNGPVCVMCGETGDPGDETAVARWPCLTVRLLAQPYAGQPGYRAEWKP